MCIMVSGKIDNIFSIQTSKIVAFRAKEDILIVIGHIPLAKIWIQLELITRPSTGLTYVWLHISLD